MQKDPDKYHHVKLKMPFLKPQAAGGTSRGRQLLGVLSGCPVTDCSAHCTGILPAAMRRGLTKEYSAAVQSIRRLIAG